MYKVIQDEAGRQASVFCDEYVLDPMGGVIYASMFGPAIAMKSIAAQIIMRRPMVQLVDLETDDFLLNRNYKPLHLLRDHESRLRVVTKTIKNGIVHKIFYVENLFQPWLYPGTKKAFVYGSDWKESAQKAFQIVNKISPIPLKENWALWLWERMSRYRDENLLVSAKAFSFCTLLSVPEEDEIKEWIGEDLGLLQENKAA